MRNYYFVNMRMGFYIVIKTNNIGVARSRQGIIDKNNIPRIITRPTSNIKDFLSKTTSAVNVKHENQLKIGKGFVWTILLEDFVKSLVKKKRIVRETMRISRSKEQFLI